MFASLLKATIEYTHEYTDEEMQRVGSGRFQGSELPVPWSWGTSGSQCACVCLLVSSLNPILLGFYRGFIR